MGEVVFKEQRTFVSNTQKVEIEAVIEREIGGINAKTLTENTKPVYTLKLHGSVYQKGARGRPRLLNLGQVYGSINRPRSFIGGDDLAKLIKIWKEYHLNDLTPGTVRQMRQIASYQKKHPEFRGAAGYYDVAKQVAKVDRGYVFGSQWLVKSIPAHVLASVRAIMKRR